MFSTRDVVADTNYLEVVSSEAGLDKLVTGIFIKNNNGSAVVPSFALAPSGTTADETYDILTLASTADDATVSSTTAILVPEGYDLWVVAAADVTVVVQGVKATACTLDIVK